MPLQLLQLKNFEYSNDNNNIDIHQAYFHEFCSYWNSRSSTVFINRNFNFIHAYSLKCVCVCVYVNKFQKKNLKQNQNQDCRLKNSGIEIFNISVLVLLHSWYHMRIISWKQCACWQWQFHRILIKLCLWLSFYHCIIEYFYWYNWFPSCNWF